MDVQGAVDDLKVELRKLNSAIESLDAMLEGRLAVMPCPESTDDAHG